MRRIAFIVVVLSLAASAALAQTVRGRVVHSAAGNRPYANVAVTLTAGANAGTVYTGGDGMFYFERVAPGRYTLTLRSRQETKRLEIVVPRRPYTDLAPVKLQ